MHNAMTSQLHITALHESSHVRPMSAFVQPMSGFLCKETTTFTLLLISNAASSFAHTSNKPCILQQAHIAAPAAIQT